MNLKQTWTKVAIVAAVLVAAGLLGWAAIRNAPSHEVAVPRTTTTYYVTNGATHLVISSTVYTVTNGAVALDDSLYARYSDLISAGILVQTLPGAGVFVNAGVVHVGAGSLLDVQYGAIVTLNTTISGTSTFVGPITSTGGFVGALTGAVTGNVTGNLAGNAAGTNATYTTITATNFVGNLKGANYITATNTIVSSGVISSLVSSYITATNAIVSSGTITNLASTNITTTNATADLGTVGGLTATYITATNGTVTTNTVTSLSLGGATFSGPIKYGKSATYVLNQPIVHGFATTPTMCILWPAPLTATLTITSTAFSSNLAGSANPVYWMCGQ